MNKIAVLIVGFAITNSYAMDCNECWRLESEMSHSIVARISMADTCRKMCESQSNLDAGRGYHTDAEIAPGGLPPPPVRVPLAYCATPYGLCMLPHPAPPGAPCGCMTNRGGVGGAVVYQ